MRLSKKYSGLQFFAPYPIRIYVNDDTIQIIVWHGTFATDQESNPALYTIDSDNRVVWNDGKFLAYNDVIVLGTDDMVDGRQYTTVGGGSTMIDIDLTTLSGYDNLAAGTYNIAVKAKAANYQDSDLSQTVSFTKLAAPVATAADTTVSWDAITNAESYDVYVDGELYENTDGGVTEYTATVKVNGSCNAVNCPITLYDGNDANGTLLTTINTNPPTGEIGTFQ